MMMLTGEDPLMIHDSGGWVIMIYELLQACSIILMRHLPITFAFVTDNGSENLCPPDRTKVKW